MHSAASIVVSLLLASLAAAQPTAYPLTVTNCNSSHTYTGPPQRAVTLNQGATEVSATQVTALLSQRSGARPPPRAHGPALRRVEQVMLALGLEAHLTATAYLDDVISEKWKQAYASVSRRRARDAPGGRPPVATRADSPCVAPHWQVNTTFKLYPAPEQLAAVKPDFLYASFHSAFSTFHINYTAALIREECSLTPDGECCPRVPAAGAGLPSERARVAVCVDALLLAAGTDATCRAELSKMGIGTYLQEHVCEVRSAHWFPRAWRIPSPPPPPSRLPGHQGRRTKMLCVCRMCVVAPVMMHICSTAI